MAFSWKDFPSISTANDLEVYLRGREYNHANYFYYSASSIINSILGGHAFWLSNVKDVNDLLDAEQFIEPDYSFMLCFSTGINENLPLWYLYSGLDGKGARIRLTKTGVRDLIQNGEFFIAEFLGKRGIGKEIKLDRKDLSMEFGDIIYAKETPAAKYTTLKYNTMTNYSLPSAEWKAFQNKHNGFSKGLIWYYEKETRLVVRLTGKAQKMIEKGKQYKLLLHFEEPLLKKMQIMFAPQIEPADIENELLKQTSIKAFRDASSRLLLSEYAGTVRIDACRDCERNENKA